MGRKSKGEGVYAYVSLIDFVVQQNLPQHCKATIHQWKRKEKTFIFQKRNRLYSLPILCPESVKVLVAQLCPTLCDPLDYSLPGSSVHGISQVRILEWVAISFSRESSWPRDRTHVSCIAGRLFTIWATREALTPSLFWFESLKSLGFSFSNYRQMTSLNQDRDVQTCLLEKRSEWWWWCCFI